MQDIEYVSIARSRDGYQPDQPEPLPTGKALNAALKAAGLPATGKVAEKQARLAAHQVDTTPPPTTPVEPAANPNNDGGESIQNPEEG